MVRYVTLLLVSVAVASPALAATPCADLMSLKLSNTTITMAEAVAAGPFVQPGRAGGPPPAAATPLMLPAHCRIAATLAPSPDSDIKIEVWLPSEGWNGKYEAVGNGGWAGTISYPAMAAALREGYATSSTDTGHVGGTSGPLIGHPEKVIDYSHRAVHEMVVTSKKIIDAFYAQPLRLSYWNGCSTGGRQGLMSAQRFPEDFDAILAGAPANYHSHLHSNDLVNAVPALTTPGALVSQAKLNMLNQAVLNACDAQDGVKDGLLNNPGACTFDPATLACKAGDDEHCFTPAQLASVKRMYAPSKFSDGKVIFPGKTIGSEASWTAILDTQKQPIFVAVGSFQLAYQDPNWDWTKFDIDRDVKFVNEKTGFVNATDPDLSKFKARGGKILMYHGWNDVAISPQNSIDYYESVLSFFSSAGGGGNVPGFYRLFMAPGMAHCSGGNGPNTFDMQAALEQWVEGGAAPDRIVATRALNGVVDRLRPLCPYPQVAVYNGTGDTNDAANFTCREQKK
ncbi:MAG TPA: tannase/feruloyl esterase family alpha/beta hydrolase [Vicinamibacterales bacterium]|nr:tannase/feruloyl esterase family alpha/beta hydrolase [Vicinamibacterales bacterium]